MLKRKNFSVLPLSISVSFVLILLFHFYVFNGDNKVINPEDEADLFTIPPPKVNQVKENHTKEQSKSETQNNTRKLLSMQKRKLYRNNGIIFSEVPKTGSTTLGKLLKSVAVPNRVLFRSHYANRFLNSRNKQLQFIRKYFIHSPLPKNYTHLGYMGHVRFMDFNKLLGPTYNQSNPIFVSIARDPVERFVSRFHYRRRKEAEFESMKKEKGLRRAKIWRNMTVDECLEMGSEADRKFGDEIECQLTAGITHYEPSPIVSLGNN